MSLMPNTVSARDIQRNYRKIFNKAKTSKKPVVVLTNNTPDVAIIDIKELEKLYSKAQQAELNDALAQIEDIISSFQRGMVTTNNRNNNFWIKCSKS